MSRVLFIGDLHFGHKNIHKFRSEFSNELHHEKTLLDNLCRSVNKRDTLWLCGDIIFSDDKTSLLGEIPGRKILVLGNHDMVNVKSLIPFVDDIKGITRYKNSWVSHAPIHPQELYGKFNIHGHVHKNTVPDTRFVNVCAENIGYTPIDFKAIDLYIKKCKTEEPLVLYDHTKWFPH